MMTIICDKCGREIPKGEKCLEFEIEHEFSERHICKLCIREFIEQGKEEGTL